MARRRKRDIACGYRRMKSVINGPRHATTLQHFHSFHPLKKKVDGQHPQPESFFFSCSASLVDSKNHKCRIDSGEMGWQLDLPPPPRACDADVISPSTPASAQHSRFFPFPHCSERLTSFIAGRHLAAASIRQELMPVCSAGDLRRLIGVILNVVDTALVRADCI